MRKLVVNGKEKKEKGETMGKTLENGRVLGQEPTCLCATTGLCSSLVWHPQQCPNLLPTFVLFSTCHPSSRLEYLSPNKFEPQNFTSQCTLHFLQFMFGPWVRIFPFRFYFPPPTEFNFSNPGILLFLPGTRRGP